MAKTRASSLWTAKALVIASAILGQSPISLGQIENTSEIAGSVAPLPKVELSTTRPNPPTPENEYYDLVLDENGKVRPHYRSVLPIWKKTDQQRFDRRSREDFRGFYSVDSLPMLMPRDQFDRKQQGEVQRGKAIHTFLQDYYSGNKTYASAGIIPESVVQRIIARNHESGFEKYITADMITYPYGADVTFDNHGKPVVIEDNVGFVGGTGDMHRSIKSLLKNQPLYKGVLNLPEPMEYYKELIATYRAHAVPKDGIIVLYQVPPYDDAEEILMAEVFPQNGVRVVTPRSKNKMVVNSKGVFLKNKKGKLERVGFVIVNSDISDNDVDPMFPGFKEKFYLDEIEEHLDSPLSPSARRHLEKLPQMRDPQTGELDYKKISAAITRYSDYENDVPSTLKHTLPGLFQAVRNKLVAVSYVPGVDFVGDKEFYTYVEDLIRFYLHQEPIISNIPTRRFGKMDKHGVVTLDEDLLNETLKNYKNYVFKVVDGRGGDGVWLGPKMTAADLIEVRTEVKKDPSRYIVQDFVQLARKNGALIDSRTVQHLFADGKNFLPKFSWGRSVPADGDGKVNVSKHGRVAPTFPIDVPASCTDEFGG